METPKCIRFCTLATYELFDDKSSTEPNTMELTVCLSEFSNKTVTFLEAVFNTKKHICIKNKFANQTFSALRVFP